jgi:hypothetical protein
MRMLVGLIVGLGLLSAPALAEDHAIGVRAGLLGVGVEYAYRLTDRLSIRGGLNGSGVDFDESDAGIDYRFNLDFDSLAVGVDFYPTKGKFRVSGGLLKNDSSLSATALAGSSFDIGDNTYLPSDVGTLRGSVGFDSVAPYVSIGWDWLHQKKVGLALELGVVDQGSPSVSLTADGPIAGDPGFMADIAAEEADLRDSLNGLNVYPFAMFGVVIRF